MNNKKITKEVYEQYIDATVALFMEYYSANLLEDIHTQLGETDQLDIVFSEELDNRCRTLIKKECAHQRRKQQFKDITKGLRYAAVLVIAALSLFSLLFVSVEAFRISVINFCIEQNSGHWDISSVTDTNQDDLNEVIDITDPLAGILPDQYNLVLAEGSSIEEVTAVYENDAKNRIFFSSTPGTSLVELDSESAQISQECTIGGHEAVLVIEENNIRIAWIDKKSSTVYTLISNNLTESEITIIAEKVIYLISK